MLEEYQKQIEEIFGTSDLDELCKIADKSIRCQQKNPRHAGRKAQLTPDQIIDVLEMHNSGAGATEIANKYGIPRQTVYKYIEKALPGRIVRAELYFGKV